MSAVPQLLDRQAIGLQSFQALMWALARPGRVVTLPTARVEDLAEALLDQHSSFHASDPLLASRLAETGANQVPLYAAEYVFADVGSPEEVSAMDKLNAGDLLQPDQSATLFARAKFGSGTRLRLTGPGIAGAHDIFVSGVDHVFWAFRTTRSRYPLGFELYLIDGDRLVGLPRSTKVEIGA